MIFHTIRFPVADMAVVCPKCGKEGTVRFDRERGMAIFQCWSCYEKKEAAPGGDTSEVTAQCTKTGKYFRVFVPCNKIHGKNTGKVPLL